MKKTFISIATLMFVILSLGTFSSCNSRLKPSRTLTTYFSYTPEELRAIKELSSHHEMKTDDVYRWDEVAFDAARKEDPANCNMTNLYAYLAIAQRDAAYLSFNTKQKFLGSLDPVSKEVLCLFFPNQCSDLSYVSSDKYSETIAKIVMKKVKERVAQDNARSKFYLAKTGSEYWDGAEPRIGIADGSLQPWFIESADQFRVPAPPAFDSAEFKEQLAITQKARREASDEQKQKVVYWAGGPGTKTTPGIWLNLVDIYMKESKVELEKILAARSVLTAAMADANIAVFDSKYTYWIRRPFMMDPTLITIMPTPNHPSYPAGHSCLSTAAKVVLVHFFPEAQKQWEKHCDEGGLSRIWGGIHYMMDHNASVVIGESVGKTAVNKLP